jgi:hypothetical protein
MTLDYAETPDRVYRTEQAALRAVSAQSAETTI